MVKNYIVFIQILKYLGCVWGFGSVWRWAGDLCSCSLIPELSLHSYSLVQHSAEQSGAGCAALQRERATSRPPGTDCEWSSEGERWKAVCQKSPELEWVHWAERWVRRGCGSYRLMHSVEAWGLMVVHPSVFPFVLTCVCFSWYLTDGNICCEPPLRARSHWCHGKDGAVGRSLVLGEVERVGVKIRPDRCLKRVRKLKVKSELQEDERERRHVVWWRRKQCCEGARRRKGGFPAAGGWGSCLLWYFFFPEGSSRLVYLFCLFVFSACTDLRRRGTKKFSGTKAEMKDKAEWSQHRGWVLSAGTMDDSWDLQIVCFFCLMVHHWEWLFLKRLVPRSLDILAL